MAASNRLWTRNAQFLNHLAQKDFFCAKPLQAQNIAFAQVFPPRPRVFPKASQAPWAGGVADANGRFLGGVSRFAPQENVLPAWGDCAGVYPTLKKEWQFLDVDALFGGVILGQFGHFLVESLARLWWIVQHQDDSRPIILLKGEGWWQHAAAGGGGGANLKSEAWLHPFFALLHIDVKRLLWIDRPSIVRNLLLPEESTHSFSFFTQEHATLCDVIAQNACQKHAQDESFDKIYLTYSQAKGNAQCVNEPLFEAFFKRQGFTVIAPETLPFSRQVALLAKAKEVACTIGTAAHLTMFCAPQTKFIGLLRLSAEPNIPQLLIQQMRKLDWFWVDVAHNFLPTHPTFGVRNLAFTDDFAHFAQYFWGKAVLKDVQHYAQQVNAEDYLRAWTQFHSHPAHFQSYLNQTRAFDFLNQLHQTFNGTPLNPAAFLPAPLPIVKRCQRQVVVWTRTQCKRLLRAILPYSTICFLYNWASQNKTRARIFGVPFRH